MSHVRTLAAFAFVVAAFAVLATVLTSGTPATAVTPAAVQSAAAQAPAPVEQLDEDPFLRALLGDTGLPANAADLSYAADRVCEGITAAVPLEEMESGVAAEFAVGEADAREFVRLAATIRCATP